MRLTTLFLIFFSAATPLFSQKLDVHYDVFKDTFYFSQNGRPVAVPKVKKGQQVVLHVENYNNYLYDVSLKVEGENVPIASSSAPVMLGGMGNLTGFSPMNILFKGSEQMMGAFKFFPTLSGNDLREGSGFVKTEEERMRQEKVAKLRKLETDFGKTKDQIFSLDNELGALQEQAQQQMKTQRIQAFAINEVNQIRYNSHLEPRQIKRLSGEYMEQIFAEKDPEKIDLNQVLKIADQQNEMPKAIQEYRKKADRYSSNSASCELILKEIKKFDFPESNLSEFVRSAESFVTAARGKSSAHLENAAALEEFSQNAPKLEPKTLSALRTTYLELHNNSFSKTYRHTAAGEKLDFKVKLSPIDSLKRQGMRDVELAPVTVSVYGGMRFRASVGLTFGQFFNRPQLYYVRDSILLSSNKDAFAPILTSFVHFYAPSKRSVSIAGSFGVGFPLGGGENLQSLSFFLGPSLLFGQGERVVLNAGLMGGRVERLTQGFSVGDQYISGANQAPTSPVYELGYYLGISFNMGGN
jgi:hypothetical protein